MSPALLALAAAGLAAASLVSPVAARADTVTTTAEVLRVVDGDTIDIRDDNRGRLRVQVLGIDTPETVKPGYTVGCWGPEATAFATSTMVGQRVALVTDPTQDSTDSFGRTLAYLIRADGWDYSVEAARAGAARSYVYGGVPVSRHDAIVAAEAEARDALRGLWGPPCHGDTSSSSVNGAAAVPPPAPLLQPPATPGTGVAPPLVRTASPAPRCRSRCTASSWSGRTAAPRWPAR
jgi:endonuclease YncB( thermonuclease family)